MHAPLIDLLIDNGSIAAIEPAGTTASPDFPAIDLEAHHVWPTLIDMHAHLDKGHIVTRTENPDGSFAGALQSTAEDRTHCWTADDIKRRMEFGLRCAYVHGVAAIRTHLDLPELNHAQRSWAVYREARAEWADRILLQAVALVPIDAFQTPSRNVIDAIKVGMLLGRQVCRSRLAPRIRRSRSMQFASCWGSKDGTTNPGQHPRECQLRRGAVLGWAAPQQRAALEEGPLAVRFRLAGGYHQGRNVHQRHVRSDAGEAVGAQQLCRV